MGDFIIRAADAFGLKQPHVVGPDIGTSAVLFAAASHPARLRSIVIGTGGAAVPLQLGGELRKWVEAPDLEPYRGKGREIVAAVIGNLERYTLSEAARADYLSAYEGDRFAESLSYVRSYPTQLVALQRLLPQIQTPVLIINGLQDPVVPPANATFLGERLPNSRVELIDAGHFIWEDAADEYASLVIHWWNKHTSSGETEQNETECDPVSGTGSLASVDMMLRGGILGDW
jgi:pimeloyl-ACP methyl ester carboxylesterase